MLNKTYKDIISSVFFILLSVIIYISSYSIKVNSSESLGPQFMPRIVAIALALLSIILLLNSVIVLNNDRKIRFYEDEKKLKLNWPLISTIALLIFYMLFMKEIGFVISSIIYLFIQISIILPKENKSKKYFAIITLISILTPIILYQIFYKLFTIFLPTGILG